MRFTSPITLPRGFVVVKIFGVLILSAVVFGGGAYLLFFEPYVSLQHIVQGSSRKLAPIQPPREKALATIDESSLKSNSVTPTITGTASVPIAIYIAKGKNPVISPISTDWRNYEWFDRGYVVSSKSLEDDDVPGGFDILNGRWSTTFFGPGMELEDGVYTVIIAEPHDGNVLATGILTIAGSKNDGLAFINITSPVTGISVSRGAPLAISWNSHGPAGAYVDLELVSFTAGGDNRRRINYGDNPLPLTGNISWIIPSDFLPFDALCSFEECTPPSVGPYFIRGTIITNTGVSIRTANSAMFNIKEF